jgi:hypothetical protein
MISLGNTIISDEIFVEKFICDLNKCKGSCCWEGDYGAPLDENELNILVEIYPKIKEYLSDESITQIEEFGHYVYFNPAKTFATPVLNNGACVYLSKGEAGLFECAIQKAYNNGVVDFYKPISCHLYPIRITSYKDYDALNYDRWDICKAACSLGAKEKVPIFRFVKDALIRKYGQEYYDEMENIFENYFLSK